MARLQDLRSPALMQSHQQSRRKSRLGLHLFERRLLLGLGDILILNLMLILALILRTNLIANYRLFAWQGRWFFTLTLMWLFMATIFEAYDLVQTARITDSLRRVVPAVLLTTIIFTATPWLTPAIINRTQAFLFIIFATMGMALWRVIYTRLFSQPTFQRRIIVAGGGAKAQGVAQLFVDNKMQDWPTHYTLLGFVDEVAESDLLGNSTQLVQLVRQYEADEVVIAFDDSAEMSASFFEAIMDCRELGVPLSNMHTFYERVSERVAIDYIKQDIELATGYKNESLVRLTQALKRLVDIGGALVGGIVLLIMIPFVWLANLLTSPGPLFFRQPRIGLNGKPFTIIKFRSMVPDAEKKSGAVWAQKNDPRVTLIGRLLRPTHLDELPQIINVLRGDMSLVGPRPERPKFVGNLTRQIPYYRARHSVRPGITGWAQVQQGYTDSVEDAKIKLEYDLYYIKHGNWLLDNLIMLRTISKVIRLGGR